MIYRNSLRDKHLRPENISGKICHMTQTENKTGIELRAIADKLLAIADAIDSENEPEPRVPATIQASIQERLAAGKCLQCGKVKGGTYRRGLCTADYAATLRKISAGRTNWAALMVAGLAGPRAESGRRRERTALDDFLDPLADQAAAAINRLAPNPSPPEPPDGKTGPPGGDESSSGQSSGRRKRKS